ncbi:MAG: HvfC family RiPP maturation protein [Gammaproteobacteria bacterium]
MPKSRPHFQEKQRAFASYIRDPDKYPVPDGVAERRMQMYRELFFNNVDGFLTSNFPVLKEILAEDHWRDLAQDFFAGHPCKTPYFSEIPEEFLDYLEHEREPDPRDPPFLLELAHYEWVEMALAIAHEEAAPVDSAFAENPLNGLIALSPLAWPLAYRYPVNRISPTFQPKEPLSSPLCLVVYRNQDYEVKFVEITPLTFRLLQLLQERGPLRAKDCLNAVAEESGHPDPAAVVKGGGEILKAMASKGIVVRG